MICKLYMDRKIFLWWCFLLICLLSSCGTPYVIKRDIKYDNVSALIYDYQTQKPKYHAVIEKHLFEVHDYNKDGYNKILAYQKLSNNVEYLRLKFDSVKAAYVIKRDIKYDDVSALIYDYQTQKPGFHAVIEKHLFEVHDYNKDGYNKILAYQKQSDNVEYLRLKFDSIRDAYEDSIVRILDRCTSLNDIASFYKNHTEERLFLKPLLSEFVTYNLQDNEYFEVRSFYKSLKNTDLNPVVEPIYLSMRDSAMKVFTPMVDKYCNKELELLEEYRKGGARGYINAVDNSFGKLIDVLIDEEWPKSMSQVKSIYQKHSSANNPIAAIRNSIIGNIKPYLREINQGRVAFVKDALDVNPGNYQVKKVNVSVVKVPVKCPTSEIMSVSKIQNKEDKVSTVLSIASFIPYVEYVATAADVVYSYKKAKDDAKEMSPHMKKMATKVASYLKAACDEEYNNSYRKLKNDIVKSQKVFRSVLYENF
ncbi:MAG: hypothetical protein J6K01_06270 [Paludibacteraceae bacterium]|nr:hypothetical protein [Paludibacteraceae bacterium]